MTIYKVKNLNKHDQTEVRIYSADKLNTVDTNTDFTALDLSEKSIGVCLTADYSIDCTGAFNSAGILESTITNGTTVLTNQGVKTAISSAIDLVNVLKTDFSLNAFIFNDYIPPITIAASYDSYLQSITVTGPSGHLVTTQTITGLTVGSGEIGVDGNVTYSIDEGMLANGTVLRTFVVDISNVVEHNLVASFRVASGITNPEVPWFSIATNMVGEFDYMTIASDATGNILFEYVGKEILEVNLADYRDDFPPDLYPTTFKNGEEIWDVRVRFKNLNTPIYLDVSEADYIYNFYDNGAANIGYHLKSSGTTSALKIKQIPNTIPSSLTNMNFMFGEVANNGIMFEPGVIDVISNWDVSHVTTMEGTFYGTQEPSPPIGNWNTLNVFNMDNMFAASTDVFTDLSQWCVPLIDSNPIGFYAMSANLRPVWGTCPRGEDITIPADDEMYFTTTAGTINYVGTIGDQILLSNGTIINIEDTDVIVTVNVPFGKHKVIFIKNSDRNNYVSISGEALTKLHNFPILGSITKFNFITHDENEPTNLVKVPTYLPPNLTNLESLFAYATNFNQDISNWDVSNVTDMSYMFYYTAEFNQDISSWNVSKVTTMEHMFSITGNFNANIGNWDTSNVTSMLGMFNLASGFNQDLSQWCVPLIEGEPEYFNTDGILSTEFFPVWSTCPRGENQV